MSVDIDQQLRALGQHLEHDAPPVGVDEILSRRRPSGSVTRTAADAPVGPGALDNRDRSRGGRRWTLVAAAVVVAMGLLGVVIVSNRATVDEPDPPSAAPVDATSDLALREPAVFPVVGERARPEDFGHFSMLARENPERIFAVVARREGNTLHDALSIMVTLAAPVDVAPADTTPAAPAGTAPAEAVGEQDFEVHGRTAEVWTEPSERDVPVQHVRFDGEPTLEVAGVDALAFMQAAGADAIRIIETSDEPYVGLEIGELPAGYELIIEPFTEQVGTISASISVGRTETTEGDYVEVSLSNPLGHSAAYSETITAVDINGHQGWIRSGPGNYVTWEPVPGTFATAGATNSPDESVALARSLEFVDRATWQAFYDVAVPVPSGDGDDPATIERVDATLIGRDPAANSGAIEIDRGLVDGIQVGMPVVNSAGLVGKVQTVMDNTSVVILLTSPDFEVSAQLVSSDDPSQVATGVVSGHGDGQPLRFTAPSQQRITRIALGDLAVTAGGATSLAPADIPIGTATAATHSTPEGPEAFEVDIHPITTINDIATVQVILYRPSNE